MTNIAFDYILDDSLDQKIDIDIKFNSITEPVGTFYDEVLKTARFIHTNTDKPIVVAYSGGIDSEVVCLGLKWQQIPFTVLSVKHKNGTNREDMENASWFCKANNITQEVVELDAEDFFSNGYKKYLNQGYKSNSVFRYFQLFLLETIQNMNSTAVLGGGEQIYFLHDNQLYTSSDATFVIPLEWCRRNSTMHYPYFFQTRPEMMAAYLENKLIKFLVSNPTYLTGFNSATTISLEKMMVLHSEFDMRRRAKFHAFRHFMDIVKQSENELSRKYVIPKHFIPVQTLRTQLGLTRI